MDQARKLVLPHHKGAAGEHLVCFDFLIRGFNGMINAFPGAPADVIVDLGKGVPLRVQVKACASATKVKNRNDAPAYRFKMRERGASSYAGMGIDLFALVALDERLVFYIPAASMFNGRRYTLRCITKTSFISLAPNSLDRFLAKLLA